MNSRILVAIASCSAFFVLGAGAAQAAGPSASASTTGPPLTAPEQAPWSVYITRDLGDGSGSFCSGSLIDTVHVVTAAHCTKDETGRALPPSAYQVYAGLVRNDNSAENNRFQARPVAAAAAHPYYSSKRSSDDVGLLTLSAPMTPTSAVQPIALAPIRTPVPTSADLQVIGWGATRAGDPDVFQHGVLVRRIEREECATGYPGVLCAGSTKDAVCPGDSGSGLVMNINGRQLIGNDSFGRSGEKCVVGTPDGYADLTSAEIGLWLRGVAKPPRAPRTTHGARVVVHRGHRVACKAPRWSGHPKLKAAFFRSGSRKPVYVGKHRYHVPAKILARKITCLSIASNANGSARAESANYIRFR